MPNRRRRKARLGDHLVVCDRSGRTVYASEARKEWNGLIVSKDEWEPRHPQEFVRGVRDKQVVPEPRPEAATELALGSSTATLAGVAKNITLNTLDLGANKSVSSVTVTITDSGITAYRPFLLLQVSDDGSNYETVGGDVVGELLSSIQSAQALSLPIGKQTRYIRVRMQSPVNQTVTATTVIAASGSDVNTTAPGDL